MLNSEAKMLFDNFASKTKKAAIHQMAAFLHKIYRYKSDSTQNA